MRALITHLKVNEVKKPQESLDHLSREGVQASLFFYPLDFEAPRATVISGAEVLEAGSSVGAYNAFAKSLGRGEVGIVSHLPFKLSPQLLERLKRFEESDECYVAALYEDWQADFLSQGLIPYEAFAIKGGCAPEVAQI